MSHCIDKRFENMLHAYEMDMLPDGDRLAFQEHLLSCRHCFERAQKLQEVAEALRCDPEARKVPRGVIDEHAGPEKISCSRRRLWPTLLPTSLVAAAVIALLVLKPWQIDIRPTQEAVATENRLAIMNFDNLAQPQDPQRLGEITTGLLIADLSESRYMQVVSSQRLYDLLQLMKNEERSSSGEEISALLAEKAQARWMLTGSILQEKPQLVLTVQLIEIASGNVLASEKVTDNEGEGIFSLIDKLSIQVRNDLTLPIAARDEVDRPVADLTTHSPLAYRYYLEGVVNYQRYYNAEAATSFRKALEQDSTLAMAYYYLSLIDDNTMIDRAVQYIDRARRHEQHYIRSQVAFQSGDIESAIRELQQVLESNPDDKEACFRIGIAYSMQLKFETAIHYYQRAIEIDPLYKTVYNQMAYTYDWMLNFEKAIESIDMYISLAPEEANPYDSRGDIYTRNGKLKPAIESYRKALEVKPDFWTSLYKLGKNNLLLGEYAVADSCFRKLSTCSDRSWRSRGLAALAYIPLRQGRFGQAVKVLDNGLAAIRTDPNGRENPLLHYLKAIAIEEQGNLKAALKNIEESIRINRRLSPDNMVYNQHLLARLSAQTGDIAKAEGIIENLRKNIGTANDTLRYAYAAASIETIKSNREYALSLFEKAAEDSVIPYTPANCLLAQAYMDAARWADAVNELKKLERDFTETNLYYGSWVVRAHYYRGVANENLGQVDSAAAEYRVFLDLWRNADSGIAEIDDARQRLARLTGKS